MEYFKIFSTEKQKLWKQDVFGYTDEYNAGFWPEFTIKRLGLDYTEQVVIPFNCPELPRD